MNFILAKNRSLFPPHNSWYHLNLQTLTVTANPKSGFPRKILRRPETENWTADELRCSRLKKKNRSQKTLVFFLVRPNLPHKLRLKEVKSKWDQRFSTKCSLEWKETKRRELLPELVTETQWLRRNRASSGDTRHHQQTMPNIYNSLKARKTKVKKNSNPQVA